MGEVGFADCGVKGPLRQSHQTTQPKNSNPLIGQHPRHPHMQSLMGMPSWYPGWTPPPEVRVSEGPGRDAHPEISIFSHG